LSSPVEDVPTTPEIVQRISNHIGESITDQQVNDVLHALNLVRAGDPVGMMKLSQDGAVARRVEVNGVVQWKVISPDGSSYNDLQPTLPGWVDLTPADGSKFGVEGGEK
jgi:hypothetical protein